MLTLFSYCRRNKRCRRAIVSDQELVDQFTSLCEKGDLKSLKEFASENDDLVNPTLGLPIATDSNHKALVEWFVSQGVPTPILTQCLVLACQRNYRDIAEILAEKGGDIYKGLAIATSSGIISSLCDIRNKRERN